MFADDVRYSRHVPESLERSRRYRRWKTILSAVVVLAVAVMIAWSHIVGGFHHDDVTATVTYCSKQPSSFPLFIYILDVDLTNVTGSTRVVIPEDDQGHHLVGVGSGDQPGWVSLKPHATYSREYALYSSDPLTGCRDLKVKAVPAGP